MESKVKLDLHGVRHEDVRRAVISFIENNWASGKEGDVITGNSLKMKELVLEVINEYNLDYNFKTVNNACIVVWFD